MIMNWFDKKPIIALAPLADLTDSSFCRICREVSGDDFVIFREMVSAEALVRDNAKTLKMCKFDKQERPIVIQIFGGDPINVTKAAEMIVSKFKPDGIDINMGCPVPKIAGRSHAGAALMKDQDRAVKIVQSLKMANLGVPISVKTRLGWGSDDEILEFAPKLEQAGVDVLTVHGRTKTQGYSGSANWEMIGKVKSILSILVIANGDITNAEDIKRCLEITKADGIMIGRAALGNPWVFSGRTPDLEEIKKVVLKHAKLHVEHYGEEFGLVAFRKHLLSYFSGIPNVKKIRPLLAVVSDVKGLEECLTSISF